MDRPDPTRPLAHAAALALAAIAACAEPRAATRASDAFTADACGAGELALAAEDFDPAPEGTEDFAAGLGVQLHDSDLATNDAWVRRFHHPTERLEMRDDILDRAVALGMRWIRYDLTWNHVEREAGRFELDVHDRLVEKAAARGLSVLFILAYGSDVHSGGEAPETPAEQCAFARYAGLVMARYGGGTARLPAACGALAPGVVVDGAPPAARPPRIAFELWNEANLSMFWKPRRDAASYARLAGLVAEAAADTDAPLVTTGLAGFDLGYLAGVLAPGLPPAFDAIGVHPYRHLDPETVATSLVDARRALADGPAGALPFWDTEWGYSSACFDRDGRYVPSCFGAGADTPPRLDGDDPRARHLHAVLAVRKQLAARSAGLPVSISYNLTDAARVQCEGERCTQTLEPQHPEQSFGLLTFDGEEKEAGTATRVMTAAVSGLRFAGKLRCAPAGVHALRFEGATRTIVLWADQSGDGKEVTIPPPAAAKDMRGDDRRVGTTLKLRADDGPIYLRY